ncbi:hypothetical protein BC826DRAFT_1104180 [Russula brevipes]|nr:hypothetical protein BC826DRAFT_1104180 [Russula brevipes]
MTPLTFLLLLFGLWSLIHLAHRLYYASAKRPRDLLPIASTARRRKSTVVTLTGPYLRVESTALNAVHDTLVQWLSPQNGTARIRTALRAVFDSGIVISLLGMLVALAVLAWTFVQLARRSLTNVVPQSVDVVHPHAKRAYDNIYVPPVFTERLATDIPVQLLVCAGSFDSSLLFIPPIPGVTLPLSHLPLLVIALFVSQVVHEAGHALSAALDGVPLQSLGASLILLLPTAFVAFPADVLATSAPRVRARIAAAGPLLSVFMCLVLLLPLGYPFVLLGYSDVSTDGLLVVSVTPGSPLASHLPPGSLLTALDELPLANAQESTWDDYLTTASPPSVPKEPAWCLDNEWFNNHPHGCCATPPPGPGSEACLIPLRSDETPRCVEAPGILAPTDTVLTRCEWSCEDGQTCARLRGGEQFLRISVQSGDQNGPTRVVLWRGQRQEVHRDVDITRWRPRSPILPLWLPSLVAELIAYVAKMAYHGRYATELISADTPGL